MMLAAKFIAFDLETTGLEAAKNEIIEFGAIKFTVEVKNGMVVPKKLGEFESFVKPNMLIPDEATRVNGITNAMVENALGKRDLSICTERRDSDIWVRVSDAGPGMSTELMERAFEPLFTTKVHGMGLGLSICRNIIRAHGGQITASRNDTRGMTFAFALPACPCA